MVGFGSTLLALSLSAHLYPVEVLVPILVCLKVPLATYVVARYHRSIDGRLLGRVIAPFMLTGLGLGYLLSERVTGVWLNGLYGAFVLLLSTRALHALVRGGAASKNRPWMRTLLVSGAGIIHGIYGTGGPLLVQGVAHVGLNKHALRDTLALVWLIMDGALSIAFVASGRLNADNAQVVVILLVPLAVATLVGEWLHHRVDERRFGFCLHGLLALAGATLIAKSL